MRMRCGRTVKEASNARVYPHNLRDIKTLFVGKITASSYEFV
jgi:hypothetical protein